MFPDNEPDRAIKGVVSQEQLEEPISDQDNQEKKNTTHQYAGRLRLD